MASAEAPAAPEQAASTSKVVPDGFKVLKEGRASILQRANDVFFNPAQVINRDMSIAVLKYFIQQREQEIKSGALRKAYSKASATAAACGVPPRWPVLGEGIRVLEGLAASGLRAIRYASEIDGVREVVANDLDPQVVEAMQRNLEFNGGKAQEKVTPSVADARVVMMQSPAGFDAVDLDPYGSPAQMLESAVQAVSEGGLLLVTATDMAVLCGNNGEACFSKYGSYPLHKPYCHEMALRILLASLERAAVRYKRYIIPCLSLSIDFYIRIFVRVYTSPAEVKNSASKLGYVWQSAGCDSFTWQRVGRKVQKGNTTKYVPGSGPAVPQECPECGSGYTMGGAFWAEPIHDPAWVKGLLQLVNSQRSSFPAFNKVHSILTAASEELPDAPLYLNLHDVCKTLRCMPPRHDTFKSALVNAGYRVSGTHACPLGVKTDAPWSAVWDVMRCWVKEHPVKPPAAGSAAAAILGKEPEVKADFSRSQQAMSRAKTKGVARFLPNPTPNWGPKSKHSRTQAPAEQQQDAQQQGAAAEGSGAAEAEGAAGGEQQEPAAEAAAGQHEEQRGEEAAAAAPVPDASNIVAFKQGDGAQPNQQEAGSAQNGTA